MFLSGLFGNLIRQVCQQIEIATTTRLKATRGRVVSR